jgi:multiple sugar transport system permease protein
MIVNMGKDNGQLFTTFGLWLSPPFHYLDNLKRLFTYQAGIFARWLANSLIYAVSVAVAGTLFSAMAGYAFSKYRFPGRQALFGFILGTIMVPNTALVLPIFLMMHKLHLTNTYWAVILPSIVNPFGLYLMRIFWDGSVPEGLIDAARIDGAGHLCIFWSIGLPLVRGGLVTVALFSFVTVWNNFFLPLVVLNDSKLFPLTLGLSVWNAVNASNGQVKLYTIIILGSFISVLPLVIAFFTLGRYWQGGLTTGATKG